MEETHTETPSVNLTLISPAIAVGAQIMCLAAVAMGAKGALRRWIAVSSLTPPELNKDNEQPTALPPRKGWRRVFNQQTGAMFGATLSMVTMYSFIFLVLPRIKSQRLVDGLWFCLGFFLVTATYDEALRFFFPVDTLVSYAPGLGSPARGWKINVQHPNPRPKWWLAISVALAVVSISAFYVGVEAFMPVLACTWVLTTVSSWMARKITMRHAVMILNGYVLFVPLLTALITGATWLLSSGDDSSDSSSSQDTKIVPSRWILQIILAYPAAFPVIAPSVMLALAMRFDHSRSLGIQPKAAPGEAVAVPRDVASFSKPIFNGGLIALSLCVMSLSLLSYYFAVPSGLEGAWILLTIPVTTLGMVLAAWARGETRTWWMYSETWIPQAEPASKSVSSDDAEARSADWETDASETEKLL